VWGLSFRNFVSSLNPLFKMMSRTTIKLDCMKTFEDVKFELMKIFGIPLQRCH
jgi:hypothetical protein